MISGDFQYESLLDPSLLEAQGSSFDEMYYPFGVPEGESTDAPQADATFDFDGLNMKQQLTQGVDSGFILPNTPQSSFPDQRYVPFPTQSQTHPGSVWRPIEQPTQQFHYPDPDIISQPQMTSTPYYPLPSANTLMPHNFGAITPPLGQQFSSIERPMFVPGSLGAPAAEAENFPYEPFQTYQDDGAFTPEDLDFSVIPDDLVATAIREGWALSEENAQQDPRPDDLYIPDAGNYSDFDASDSEREYKPSSSSARSKRASHRINRNRISKPSRSQAILANGEVKKGRPCAKPQTEERKRVNQRRMEGYYRRKNDQGNLEKARLQSRESYWRRKQRRIEAGETVRSYNPNKGRRG